METLLSVVLFAALFFLMMRFGCGAHMMHGGGKEAAGGHDAHGGGCCGGGDVKPAQGVAGDEAKAGSVKDVGGVDPVCGMPVSTAAGFSTTHAGTRYRFCAGSCLEEFEAHPERYVVAPREGAEAPQP